MRLTFIECARVCAIFLPPRAAAPRAVTRGRTHHYRRSYTLCVCVGEWVFTHTHYTHMLQVLNRLVNFLKATFNLIISTLACVCFCICKTNQGSLAEAAEKQFKDYQVNRSRDEVTAELGEAVAKAKGQIGEPFSEDCSTIYSNMPSGGEWKRAKDFLPVLNEGTPISLFGDGALPMDLGQGQIGDCYLLASLSALAEEAGRVEALFANSEYDEATSNYIVHLFKDGGWVAVQVDDQFWVDSNTNKPLCCNTKGTSRLWPMILEKAYCKLIFAGDFGKLGGGGQPYQALHHLRGLSTGRVGTEGLTREFSEQDCYNILYNKVVTNDDGCVVAGIERMPWGSCVPSCLCGALECCCMAPLAKLARTHLPLAFAFTCAARTWMQTTSDCFEAIVCCPLWSIYQYGIMQFNMARTGLVATHAYAVLDVKNVPIDCLCGVGVGVAPGETVKLVKLRNPWGTGEWHGAFSDKSCYWSAEARETCKLEAAEDGVFWMTLTDFRRYFGSFSVAPFESALVADSPQIEVQVMER